MISVPPGIVHTPWAWAGRAGRRGSGQWCSFNLFQSGINLGKKILPQTLTAAGVCSSRPGVTRQTLPHPHPSVSAPAAPAGCELKRPRGGLGPPGAGDSPGRGWGPPCCSARPLSRAGPGRAGGRDPASGAPGTGPPCRRSPSRDVTRSPPHPVPPRCMIGRAVFAPPQPLRLGRAPLGHAPGGEAVLNLIPALTSPL